MGGSDSSDLLPVFTITECRVMRLEIITNMSHHNYRPGNQIYHTRIIQLLTTYLSDSDIFVFCVCFHCRILLLPGWLIHRHVSAPLCHFVMYRSSPKYIMHIYFPSSNILGCIMLISQYFFRYFHESHPMLHHHNSSKFKCFRSH